MSSGFNDTVVNAVLNSILGSSAGSILGTTIYLDLLTTAPSDDNGTGAVSWGQGRTAVTVASSTFGAASGRTKTGTVTSATNGSGSTITVVAFAWYSASSSGTYLGGAPLPAGGVDIAATTSANVTVTLSSPSPS